MCWTVDGYTTGTLYVLNKGIKDTNFLVSPDELTVSSQLIVPTTKANNNTVVIYTVEFNHQSSDLVRHVLQGKYYIFDMCIYGITCVCLNTCHAHDVTLVYI